MKKQLKLLKNEDSILVESFLNIQTLKPRVSNGKKTTIKVNSNSINLSDPSQRNLQEKPGHKSFFLPKILKKRTQTRNPQPKLKSKITFRTQTDTQKKNSIIKFFELKPLSTAYENLKFIQKYGDLVNMRQLVSRLKQAHSKQPRMNRRPHQSNILSETSGSIKRSGIRGWGLRPQVQRELSTWNQLSSLVSLPETKAAQPASFSSDRLRLSKISRSSQCASGQFDEYFVSNFLHGKRGSEGESKRCTRRIGKSDQMGSLLSENFFLTKVDNSIPKRNLSPF